MRVRLSEDSYERTIAATGDTVQPGGTVDVDDDLGRRLCEQENVWSAVDDHTCTVCGFEAKTAGGLATHANTHDDDEDDR